MCGRFLDSEPCVNYKCPHNLFWEELGLDREKIQMTDKALEIRNCCRRIIQPWTSEEISDTWGLTKEVIRQSQAMAWRKVQKEYPYKQLKKSISS
jgi:hypothetical protein